jgi:hypothetical protein
MSNSRLTLNSIGLSILLGMFNSCTNQQHEITEAPPEVKMMDLPAAKNSSLPYLISNKEQLFLSWMEQQGDTAIFKYAALKEGKWSGTEAIARGTDWFVNWADYPMVAVNASGDMSAHFLAKNGDAYFSYDVNIVRKPSGQSWSSPLVPHQDGTPTEHGFVTMLPVADDSFQLAWLDGRNTSSESLEHHGAMTLRTAIMNMDGSLSEELELDDQVCDCCQTGGAITNEGPIIVYRNRSGEEVRDIAIVRKVNGQWTDPSMVYDDHWEIAGCPVNGPRADAIGNHLGIAWFAAPDNKPEVKVIFSDDGGENFKQPVMIDNQFPLGRVDLVMLDQDRALVSWLCKESGKTLIKAIVVNSNGDMDTPVVIAESSEARGSGFPQMTKYNGSIYFAWTKLIDQNQSEVKMARLGLL